MSYKTVFKCSDSDKEKFKTSQCLLTISVGQEAHEGEKFAAIEFVNSICQADPFVEFHITNTQGSFLLLDKEGIPNWLAVADSEQMRMYCELAEDVDSSPAIFEALKTKQMIPYFETSADLRVSPVDWQRYLHPAKTLQGKETYYYAHIQDPKAYPLERDKLVSYRTFLATLT
jgi:hypothetical protein